MTSTHVSPVTILPTMQRPRRHLVITTLTSLALTLAITACGSDDAKNDDPAPGLANPASDYCVAQGGEVESIDTADGQVGMCNLPDGTSVDEWEYYRESHPDATTP